jgi:hypothetical protein
LRGRRPIAVLLGLLALLASSRTVAVGVSGQLEGHVLDPTGSPAAGFTVYLIGEGGHELGAATVDPDGSYLVTGVRPGRYALGVGNRSGQRAPVAAPPVEIRPGGAVRRDLVLAETDEATRRRALAFDPSLGSWWGRLTTPAKGWVVLASLVAGWFLYDGLTGDDTEVPASPQ